MFTYFIPLTVNLTKNSKLEKFVHELNALWKLSGSSLGALRELVAVAGIYWCPSKVHLYRCSQTNRVGPNFAWLKAKASAADGGACCLEQGDYLL